MPLYDFQCLTCGAPSTQLLKSSESTAACPACGSLNLEKLLAPFTARTGSLKETSTPVRVPAESSERHVCTSACQHGTADKLVKKYLGN
jgi:putative FmdB family regulatory protein